MRFHSRYVRDYLNQSGAKKILIWAFQILVAILLAAVAAIFFFQTVTMQEGSMEPTIQAGQKVCINRMAYKLGSPKRGDIIAFQAGSEEHASIHVKRIIGLPGDTVQIRDGEIYINDEKYTEQSELGPIENPGLAEGGITLGSDEYFVLGDNRDNSEDSRYADIGNVKKRYIKGKIWFSISPLHEFGFISS